MQKGRAEGVEGAGADVAVDDAEHAEHQGQARRPAMADGGGGGAGGVQGRRSEGTARSHRARRWRIATRLSVPAVLQTAPAARGCGV
jgi:hypothetical protein